MSWKSSHWAVHAHNCILRVLRTPLCYAHCILYIFAPTRDSTLCDPCSERVPTTMTRSWWILSIIWQRSPLYCKLVPLCLAFWTRSNNIDQVLVNWWLVNTSNTLQSFALWAGATLSGLTPLLSTRCHKSVASPQFGFTLVLTWKKTNQYYKRVHMGIVV